MCLVHKEQQVENGTGKKIDTVTTRTERKVTCFPKGQAGRTEDKRYKKEQNKRHGSAGHESARRKCPGREKEETIESYTHWFT